MWHNYWHQTAYISVSMSILSQNIYIIQSDVMLQKQAIRCSITIASALELIGPHQRTLAELYCFRLVGLSVCLSVVTLTQSFIIGFLPNFIYGLLPSTSHSSLNTGFVRHPITKMADKMAATYQCLLLWSLLPSHFLSEILSNFIYRLLSSNTHSSSTKDNQDGWQNGRRLSVLAVVVSLTKSFFIGFLQNFMFFVCMDCFHQTLVQI